VKRGYIVLRNLSFHWLGPWHAALSTAPTSAQGSIFKQWTLRREAYHSTANCDWRHKTKYVYDNFTLPYIFLDRSRWPHDLCCGSAATCLLDLWVRIRLGIWIFVYCECCVLSGRGLCVGPITRPEESYRVWCVWVWSWSPISGGCDSESGRSTRGKRMFVRWFLV
jgi:hypothetical protein